MSERTYWMPSWYPLPLKCMVVGEDDGTYTAKIVDADLEGNMKATGDTMGEALNNLKNRVLFGLKGATNGLEDTD